MDRYTKGFIVASVAYFFAGAVFGIWMGAAEAPGWTHFAHIHFNLLGFMAMMIYGVGYFILPRFNAKPLHWESWLPAHFYVANIGLLGLVATSAERPSIGFTIFAVINVISVAMFSLNIAVTILSSDEEENEIPAAEPVEPEIDIGPKMRMGEIITRWPELVDILVKNGFSPLEDPDHREQVKQMPITLGMACERHGLDIEMIASLLTQGARSIARQQTQNTQTIQPLSSIKGALQAGDTITHRHIIGDILKVYPATEEIFRKYYGSACFSCPGQATENIRQSAMMHNVDEQKVLSDLNQIVSNSKTG